MKNYRKIVLVFCFAALPFAFACGGDDGNNGGDNGDTLSYEGNENMESSGSYSGDNSIQGAGSGRDTQGTGSTGYTDNTVGRGDAAVDNTSTMSGPGTNTNTMGGSSAMNNGGTGVGNGMTGDRATSGNGGSMTGGGANRTGNVENQVSGTAAIQRMVTNAGNEFDNAFLQEMIRHHQEGLEMARMALTSAKHRELRDFANTMIQTQQQDIDKMRKWQQQWYSADRIQASR